MIGRSSSGSGGIKSICKVCGKPAPSSEFVLDPVYKQMACPACVAARKDKEKSEVVKKKEEQKAVKQQEQLREQLKNKPAGWDAEDEYLDKLYRQKQKMVQEKTAAIERISPEKIRYACPKCKYKFVYDETKQHPSSCPYCGTPVKY